MSTNYTINEDRWAKLDIFNQMGNIYSEVGRSLKTKGQKDSRRHEEAIDRAIELFDATIRSLIAKKSPQSKEVLRAKEQFLDIVLDDNASVESTQSLERYFMQFAIAARLNH